MPIGIAFRFLAGRYHGTLWGRHVNEGTVEWPPSPWRLLRALVAAWKLKGRPAGDPVMVQLLIKLLSPPQYLLPPATLGHTRHYMPLYKAQKTLVFDAFAAICPETELTVTWPDVDLTAAERMAFGWVLDTMSYLGRAESWCSARLLNPEEAARIEPNCVPQCAGSRLLNAEPYRLLAPASDAIVPSQPTEHWPLCAETGELRRRRWSDPPGSRWVTYMRPKHCFSTVENRFLSRPRPIVNLARYALGGPVLPLLQEALSLGELARRRLQGIYGRQNAMGTSPILSGKSIYGTPLSGHEHAMFLATDEDHDGKLDHLTICALGGFSAADLLALDELRQLRQVGGKPDLEVVLTGLGAVDDFRGLGLFGPGRVWRSVTPFVPVRHSKRRRGKWVDTADQQIRLELSRRRIPEPVSIRPLESCALRDGRSIRWIEFRTDRLTGHGVRAVSSGCGFELTFSEDIIGPLALGYGCHFGLGQFHTLAR